MITVFQTKSGLLKVTNPPETQFDSEELMFFCVGTPLFTLDSLLVKNAMLAPCEKLSCLFDGAFLAVFYQKKEKTLILRQSFFGCPLNIWLAQRDNDYIISDSLKDLKEALNRRFEFDDTHLKGFFYNGFVYGSDTLVKNVKKLYPGCSMKITRQGIQYIQDQYSFDDSPLDRSPEELYDELMIDAVRRVMNKACVDERYHMSLSSGYDSNFNLWAMRKLDKKTRIHSYCLGGVRGQDETKVAKKISKKYKRVSFSKAMVTPKTLEHLDEIVSFTEGNCYERGIFLTYELGKLLKKHNCRHLITGDFASELFNTRVFNQHAADIAFLADNSVLSYPDYPFEMGANIVRRKEFSILSNYGITVHSPYMDGRLLSMAYKIRNLNGPAKKFHKQQCYRLLPPDVSCMLAAMGGATNMIALFDKDFDCMRQAKNFHFYDENYVLSDRYSYSIDEAECDYYLALAYLDSFCKQFIDEKPY